MKQAAFGGGEVVPGFVLVDEEEVGEFVEERGGRAGADIGAQGPGDIEPVGEVEVENARAELSVGHRAVTHDAAAIGEELPFVVVEVEAVGEEGGVAEESVAFVDVGVVFGEGVERSDQLYLSGLFGEVGLGGEIEFGCEGGEGAAECGGARHREPVGEDDAGAEIPVELAVGGDCFGGGDLELRGAVLVHQDESDPPDVGEDGEGCTGGGGVGGHVGDATEGSVGASVFEEGAGDVGCEEGIGAP